MSEITIELPSGQLKASTTEDGGLALESTVRLLDGRPDHLVIETRLSRVDARRVFELFAAESWR